MKVIIVSLVAAALFAGSFAFIYRLGLQSQTKLRPLSLVCMTPESLAEARDAVSVDDQGWVDSIHACFTSTFEMKARALECGWRNCRVRLWYPTGESQTVYVNRGRLDS